MARSPDHLSPPSLFTFETIAAQLTALSPDLLLLKQALAAQNNPGLAYDLDRTIFDTATYWVEQLKQLTYISASIPTDQITTQYPHLQDAPFLSQHRLARQWMENAIHSNQLQSELPLIPKAKPHLTLISQALPVSAYISRRPQAVASGTQKSLEKHCLPKAKTILFPAPIPPANGNLWKAACLDYLYPEVLGIVDDSLDLIDSLPKEYPGIIFLFGQTLKPDTALDVIPCPDWQSVLSNVLTR
jgi:hypothetical protein